MKLIIKNLKQIVYNVEIESDKSTVLDLKKEIEKSHGFDSNLLKLLFNGVVLDDSKTLENYKIQDESVIIMMNTKIKPKNVQPVSESQPSTQNQEQKKEEKKPEEKKEEKKPAEKKENKNEEKYTQQLNSLTDMGFERGQAEAAIKAARGQIDLAIEFLYNGIPEGINDLDGDQMEGEGEGEDEGDGDGDDDPLKKVASIAKIMCQNNPGRLTTLLQNIQQNDPDLMNLIKEREEEFKTLLEKPVTEADYRAVQSFQQEMGLGTGGHSHGSGRGQIRISLTQEEREAINRLKDLGNFSEADVLQAFFACEKNEELTANYLFEQKMRDDDEMFKNNNNNNNNNGPSK
jgi:UV excision repair protein RAD23